MHTHACTHAGGWDKHSPAGKHSSSALTQTVAAEGLADSYMSFNTNYHDTGVCAGLVVEWSSTTRPQWLYQAPRVRLMDAVLFAVDSIVPHTLQAPSLGICLGVGAL